MTNPDNRAGRSAVPQGAGFGEPRGARWPVGHPDLRPGGGVTGHTDQRRRAGAVLPGMDTGGQGGGGTGGGLLVTPSAIGRDGDEVVGEHRGQRRPQVAPRSVRLRQQRARSGPPSAKVHPERRSRGRGCRREGPGPPGRGRHPVRRRTGTARSAMRSQAGLYCPGSTLPTSSATPSSAVRRPAIIKGSSPRERLVGSRPPGDGRLVRPGHHPVLVHGQPRSSGQEVPATEYPGLLFPQHGHGLGWSIEPLVTVGRHHQRVVRPDLPGEHEEAHRGQRTGRRSVRRTEVLARQRARP